MKEKDIINNSVSDKWREHITGKPDLFWKVDEVFLNKWNLSWDLEMDIPYLIKVQMWEVKKMQRWGSMC